MYACDPYKKQRGDLASSLDILQNSAQYTGLPDFLIKRRKDATLITHKFYNSLSFQMIAGSTTGVDTIRLNNINKTKHKHNNILV